MDWKQKEIWSAPGKGFLVQVSRHSEASDAYEFEGPHRWCVYAYIYPRHAHFAAFKGSDMWQTAAGDLHLHSGCSLLRYHYDDDGKVLSVQVGSDYHHLYDDAFTRMATKEEAYAVFSDAEELHSQLTRLGVPA